MLARARGQRLADTLDTLSSNGMCSAGAGHDRQAAEAPAVLPPFGLIVSR